MRVALGIEYDGSAFFGWQKQPDARSVQSAVERAAERFLGSPVATICAGRTDTGVHGLGQVVHLDTPLVRGESNWVRAMNTFLSDDAAVRWARIVPDTFNARFSAVSRTYEYWIWNDPVRSPLLAKRTGWVFRPCDESLMQQGAGFLLGEHDFSSFRASECQAATPVRTVHEITVRRFGRLIGIRLRANAFLQHMVRNIVGTLVYVGTGRERPGWVKDVLLGKSRALAAPTFEAAGLYLTGVEYPGFDVPQGADGPFHSFS